MLKDQLELAKKTAYATIGAPVVATRAAKDAAKDYSAKITEHYSKLTDKAEKQFDVLAGEGAKLTKKLQSGDVVEEIQSRMDLEKVQDRVEKLRDQLEHALQSWRESFTPAEAKPAAKKVKVEAAKPAAKKTPTKKTTSAKKAPAARKTTAKATTAKPTAEKTPAKKATAAKKTPAKAAASK